MNLAQYAELRTNLKRIVEVIQSDNPTQEDEDEVGGLIVQSVGEFLIDVGSTLTDIANSLHKIAANAERASASDPSSNG